MKNIKEKLIYEGNSNMFCVYPDLAKIDCEKLGEALIELGEALKKNSNKIHELVITNYKNDDDKQVVKIRVKDRSYNEIFTKQVND